MQKNLLIALAIVGTLTAGFFLFNNRPSKVIMPDEATMKKIYDEWRAAYKHNVGVAPFRYKIFCDNYKKMLEHNSLNKSYTLGLNQFSSHTQEEFASLYHGLMVPKNRQRNVVVLPTDNLKTSADWRSKMNAVKDQQQCGSCWAFSAVGALEGLHSVANDNLMNLSEQELVDCSGSYGNMGCNGGLMDYAFSYIKNNKGIALQADYKYAAVDLPCKASGKSRNGPISGFVDVPANSAAALKAAIAKQPVSVAIEADTFTFQAYKSGVINDSSCGTNLDHGVVAVGYDDAANPPYYLVRNSWGAGWGENGHVRIGIKDGEGICGIQKMASYPTA